MRTDRAVLTDRTVVEVSGPEARDFLQRLVTNDVETLEPGSARYAALLTPQGKIVADFFVVAAGPGRESVLLDVADTLAADLVRKLTLYRLRAKVTIADRSGSLGVVAFAPSGAPDDVVQAFADPRGETLWHRAIVAIDGPAPHGDDAGRWAYREQRIRAGVPEGGLDFTYGETFPHEANLDRLHGVDFRKGCYVGQEVVSRVEHRGTARKRIVSLAFDGEAPPVGSAILADGLAIGTMGSSIEGLGLGLVRLDRVEDVRHEHGRIVAAGVPLRLAGPDGA